MEKRLDYIDKLRGFAILLVVMGHLYLPYTVQGNSHPVAEMIYSFHMPLFFFISGYLCEITHKIARIGYLNFVRKKVISLLIPYLFWIVAVIFLFTHKPITTFGDFILLFNFFPNKLFWFMPVLFLIMLLYMLQYRLLQKKDSLARRLLFVIIVCGLLCILGVLLHEYFLLIYAIYVFSFLIGALVMKEESIQERILDNRCYGGASLVLCVLWLIYPFDPNGRILYSALNVLLTLLCSISAIIVFYNFFIKVSLCKPIDWFFSEMGRMSIVIYLTPLVMFPKGFIFDGLTVTTENLIILLVAIIQCLLAYSIGKFIYKIPYLRLIMYGKK